MARLTDVLATGAIGDSTRKEYNGRFRTFATFRAARGKGPWLLEKDGVEEAVRELTTFMSYRCFVFKNQSQTVRGYLSAIKFFHKMYAGWELPTTHCMVLAVGKGIDRVQGKGDVKPRVRKPLSWDMLWDGKNEVLTAEGGGPVMWMGLALAYFLLCRASELFAYDSGMVHPDYCLTRRDLTFFKGVQQLKWVDRREADKVEICFRVSKADQKRIGAVVTRTRGQQTEKRGGREVGALEILLDLIDTHPDLDMTAPLMQSCTTSGWKVITRSEATRALRLLVSCVGREPSQYALHSGRIGGATHLAAQGASELQIQRAGRWKSLAFMVYVRAGGEGAEFVSRALSRGI